MNTTYYFQNRLSERFNMDVQEVLEIVDKLPKFSQSNRHQCYWYEVQKKLNNPNYPNSQYHVDESNNMILVSDGDTLINCLYLDGRWGY